ncbi:unnamed protein product [Coregonus sp. 'balchen']|nr:unnamed protein product [Coregonus sp. 'balchen']
MGGGGEERIQTNNITKPCRLMNDTVDFPTDYSTSVPGKTRCSLTCFRSATPLLLCGEGPCQASPLEAEYNGSVSVRLHYTRTTVTDSPGAQVRAVAPLPPSSSKSLCYEKNYVSNSYPQPSLSLSLLFTLALPPVFFSFPLPPSSR